MRFGTEAMLSEYEVHSRQPTDHLVQQHLPLVKRLASQLAVKLHRILRSKTSFRWV